MNALLQIAGQDATPTGGQVREDLVTGDATPTGGGENAILRTAGQEPKKKIK